MAIQHAVLALLAGGPSYGYQLKGAFEAAVGPQWGPLNIGHLYQILERLSRDGLVVSERHPQALKPDRVVYEITPAGRGELDRWLDEPSPRSGGYRDDFFLKLTAAARAAGPDTVRTVLTNQRLYLLRELRNLDSLRRDAEDPVAALLLSAASRHVTADLAFVDDAEDALLRDDGATLALVRQRLAPPADDEGTCDGAGGDRTDGARTGGDRTGAAGTGGVRTDGARTGGDAAGGDRAAGDGAGDDATAGGAGTAPRRRKTS